MVGQDEWKDDEKVSEERARRWMTVGGLLSFYQVEFVMGLRRGTLQNRKNKGQTVPRHVKVSRSNQIEYNDVRAWLDSEKERAENG